MGGYQMELQEYLDQEEQVKEGFKIEDDQSANWALRKIKSLKQQMQQNLNLAEAEIERIAEWEKQENGKIEQSIDYFQGLLAKYAMQKREEDPRFKTLSLPHGKIGFRKKQSKWIYNDDQLLDTLTKHNLNDYIKVKYQPDKAQIKKAFEVVDGKVVDVDTGVIIEGITVEEQGEDFNVKVDDE